MQIDWEPISKDGGNFCTFRLSRLNRGRLSFKPSIFYIIFSFLFLIAGVWLLVFLSYGEPVYRSSGSSTFGDILSYFLGVAFSMAGMWMVVSLFDEVSFNALKQTITINRKSNLLTESIELNFSQIDSLQMLSKQVKDSDGGYLSYELNVILLDGSRMLLVAHGNDKIMIKDANLLSKILNKELHTNAH